jgi:hypothetical protein
MLATRRMGLRCRPIHYYPPPTSLRNNYTLAVRRLRCENESINCFDCWYTTAAAAAVSRGQTTTRRWIVTDHSHHLLHFGRVISTDSQMERTRQIRKHGKGKDWQRILETFINEREDYGLVDLATTLSQLARIQSFKRDHPVLREMLATIANYIDESMIDARNYSNICHSIAKLQARDDSAQRIVNHLSTIKFAKDFLDSGNPQDISNVAWALARLQRPELMKVCSVR